MDLTLQHILNLTRLTAPESPLGFAVWHGISWLQATQVQQVGVTVFCMERHSGSTHNSTPCNMGWTPKDQCHQTLTVSADSWPGDQKDPFKAGAFPCPGGCLWVCGTRGWPCLPYDWVGRGPWGCSYPLGSILHTSPHRPPTGISCVLVME